MTEITVDRTPTREPRPYDYKAGDERKTNREEAIARAVERTYERDCRQVVRSSSAPDFVGGPFWLIQDVR